MKKAALSILAISVAILLWISSVKKEPETTVKPTAPKAEYNSKFLSKLNARIQESEPPHRASDATPEKQQPLRWKNYRIPNLKTSLTNLQAHLTRIQGLAATSHGLPAISKTSDRHYMDDVYGVESVTKSGLVVRQMFHTSDDQISSEMWEDPQLGKVMRGFDYELDATTISTEKGDGNETFYYSIPNQHLEVLSATAPNTMSLWMKQNGESFNYFFDHKQRRAIEYVDGRKRQFEMISAELYREVDENGTRLSFYKFTDGRMVKDD